MHYSLREMVQYVLAIGFFLLIPLLFLSTYPVTQEYYGDFTSLTWTFLTKQQLSTPNTTGLLSDLLILHLIWFVASPKRTQTKERFLRLLHSCNSVLKGRPLSQLTTEEWLNVRVYLVKIFFVPLMMLFVASLLKDLSTNSFGLFKNLIEGKFFFMILALVIMSALFIIDVSCFILGYLTESSKLNNVILSVDPTVSGWLVCLICYPPFNASLTGLVGGMYEIGVTVPNAQATLILTSAGLILMSIYTKASVDLMFKASNLTYRGLVTHGTYSVVRHPAYASKVLTWTILTLPFTITDPWLLFTIFVWVAIYVLRALTEERHLLSADPEAYVDYMKKVPYRFIPGII